MLITTEKKNKNLYASISITKVIYIYKHVYYHSISDSETGTIAA